MKWFWWYLPTKIEGSKPMNHPQTWNQQTSDTSTTQTNKQSSQQTHNTANQQIISRHDICENKSIYAKLYCCEMKIILLWYMKINSQTSIALWDQFVQLFNSMFAHRARAQMMSSLTGEGVGAVVLVQSWSDDMRGGGGVTSFVNVIIPTILIP